MSKVIEIIDSDEDNNNTPVSSSNTSLVMSSETDDYQQPQSKRRRRKSALHVMTDPDMQFQTISLEDDDEDDAFVNNPTQSIPPVILQAKNTQPTQTSASRAPPKVQKIAPKILAPKPPTNAEIVDAHYEKFLNDPETLNDVYAIAEERARINYLLSLNGMPEINFTLYTRPERLQFQFEERLKQRKMLNNWDSRRTFLQNNED